MTTKIVVAAAMCTPTRTHVRNALQPYGVKFGIGAEYWGDVAGQAVIRASDAYLQVCEVLVNDQAAVWAEYLMVRSGKLQLISKPLDRRNLRWALQWGGAMPRPWVEAGCDVKALAASAGAGSSGAPVTAGDGGRRAGARREVDRRPVRRRRERRERY